jgi:lipopolysaccharide cholinephosphotransferase
MSRQSKQNLVSRKLNYARKTLIEICQLLDTTNIPYHLEGGTLLGIVRDGDLLPWDGDLDISIPVEYANQLRKQTWRFFKMGKKLSVRKSKLTNDVIQYDQISLFKLKPLGAYILRMFLPNHEILVLDIFTKVKDEKYVYWQANGKIMRVDKKHYESHEIVSFLGIELKVPNQYKEYLTKKYGNWSVPIKQWDCAKDELTIVN